MEFKHVFISVSRIQLKESRGTSCCSACKLVPKLEGSCSFEKFRATLQTLLV